MECVWWEKVMNPVRRVWNGVVAGLRIRKRGLLELRRDVRACEYQDVHVMWDMLSRNKTENSPSFGLTKNNRNIWNYFKWARCTPYACSRF